VPVNEDGTGGNKPLDGFSLLKAGPDR